MLRLHGNRALSVQLPSRIFGGGGGTIRSVGIYRRGVPPRPRRTNTYALRVILPVKGTYY